MKTLLASALAAGSIALGAAAFADSAPLHLRGEVGTVAAHSFELTPIGGASVSVEWDAKTRIATMKPAQIADIVPGLFVGTAAIPQPDGTLKALEVHIFPEEMRGTGEGFRPFPQVPKGTMTNATVTDIVGTQGAVSDSGLTLTLKYQDGDKTVLIPKGTPVVLLGPGDASMLQPHAKVSVTATKDASGKLIAGRIAVGLDGVMPPI
jgi:hypothetical protein